jgi:hypothetical protein
MSERKHANALQRLLADAATGEGLKTFPPSSCVTPEKVARLAGVLAKHGEYLPAGASYFEWALIRNLVFTLMEEWGWTAEARGAVEP